jgi:hypothetical protein
LRLRGGIATIQGGDGSGATAIVEVSHGFVTAIHITNVGIGYGADAQIVIEYPPFSPKLSIEISKVKVTKQVMLGRTYLLESSSDLVNYTPVRNPFIATSEVVAEER